MSKKHLKVSRVLNYVDHLLIATSTIPGCVSIFDFTSLVGIPIRIARSVIRLKIYVITAGIIKYKSIIKKRKKEDGKIVLLTKFKLKRIEVLTSKALVDSNISHDEFVLINNVLKELNDMREEIKKFQ